MDLAWTVWVRLYEWPWTMLRVCSFTNVRPVGSCPPAVSVTRFGPPATVHHHLIDKESHMEQCR